MKFSGGGVGTFLWTKTSTPPALSNKQRKTIEYLLCYEKNPSNQRYFGSLLDNGDVPLLNTGNPSKILTFPPNSIEFKFKSTGTLNAGDYEKLSLKNEIIVENGKNQNEAILEGSFKWGQPMLNEEVANGTTFIIKSEKMSIRFQRKFDETSFKTPNNNLDLEINKTREVGTNESAVSELDSLGLKNYFDFPKPVSLVRYLVQMLTKFSKNGIILDFFSGSGTTAHAVMQLNAEDGGNRKFIMVQLPEKCVPESEAARAGYANICEIGKERIRRAGTKIRESLGLAGTQLDVGFRVLKVDSGSREDVMRVPDETSQNELSGYESNLKADRSALDLLFACILDWGLELTGTLRREEIGNREVYFYGNAGAEIAACFDERVNDAVVEEIAKRKPARAVFRDGVFDTSSTKINAVEIFKHYAPEADVKVI